MPADVVMRTRCKMASSSRCIASFGCWLRKNLTLNWAWHHAYISDKAQPSIAHRQQLLIEVFAILLFWQRLVVQAQLDISLRPKRPKTAFAGCILVYWSHRILETSWAAYRNKCVAQVHLNRKARPKEGH